MNSICLIKHSAGAPGLRFLGLGPSFIPRDGMTQLQLLLNTYTFWAKNRSKIQLRNMLAESSAVVSIWKDNRMVGFGRATSDYIYRAVLWDIVVADDQQRLGLGRLVVNALMESKCVKEVEKTYLMTTNETNFYEQVGFKQCKKKKLMIHIK